MSLPPSGARPATAAAIDDPRAIREADAEVLSLALIDARNELLRWLAAFETAGLASGGEAGVPAWRRVGRAAWYQEHWISRHVQCQRGEHCDATGLRLASIEPRADAWFGPGPAADEPPPDPAALRAYLAETLEITLDLLHGAGPGADALHFYRAALLHEDRLCESLAELAAELQLGEAAGAPWRPMPARPPREALWLPASVIVLGSVPGGFVPDNERWGHEVRVPEFEIDAQPVDWSRYVEFAEDGGYDRRELWSEAGWAWQQAVQRRAPRGVERLRGGAAVMREGRLQRAGPQQPALHLTRHEAEAWCHWAGRRLPTEPEWELAALQAATRGWAWGDVFEWVAGTARPWPCHVQTPGSLDRLPERATTGVLRGASWMTRRRWRHPKARRFAPPAADTPFCGFRSCAL